MAICGDYGGRTASGGPCKHRVHSGSRCPQHRKPVPLSLVAKGDEVDALTHHARDLWYTYSAVLPKSLHPELWMGILALNGSVVLGDDVARGVDPDGNSPSMHKKRLTEEWLAVKSDLGLAARLESAKAKTGLEKLRAMSVVK